MFGNHLSRSAIVNARLIVSRYLGRKEPTLSKAARELADCSHRYRSDGPMTYLCEALNGVDDLETAVATFLILRASYESDHYAASHAIDGVSIVVENNDDDPTMINFTINNPAATAWAKNSHGSLAGGTWETADGEDLVYDSTFWHKNLIADLIKEGYNLDLSAYSEPDERDVAIAAHASECEVCQGDWRTAEECFDDATAMVAHAVITEK